MKILKFFLTFWPISKQTADVKKNVDGIDWPAIDALRLGYHSFSVPSMVTKLWKDLRLIAPPAGGVWFTQCSFEKFFGQSCTTLCEDPLYFVEHWLMNKSRTFCVPIKLVKPVGSLWFVKNFNLILYLRFLDVIA